MNIIQICFDRFKKAVKSSVGPVLILLMGAVPVALAGITFSNTAITGDSSFTNITGATSTIFDVGSGNTLSLQTTNNGPITTGSGLVTLGGNLLVSGTSTLTGISDITNIDRSGVISIGTSSATTITIGRSGQALSVNSGLTAGANFLVNGTSTLATTTIASLRVTGTSTLSGAVGMGALTVGSGTAIAKHISATSSLTFGVIASTTCKAFTATVTGANATDTLVATPAPVASGIDTVSSTWVAWLSATSEATVRACNPTFSNTASVAAQTWRLDVWQH